MRALKSPQTTTVFFCCQCSISTVKALRSSANSAWLRRRNRAYIRADKHKRVLPRLALSIGPMWRSNFCPFQRSCVAAHDILFDQEPCSATGSTSVAYQQSLHKLNPGVMTVCLAGSSHVSWIAQTVMSLLVRVAHVHRFVNVLLHFQTAHVPRPNVYCTAVYGLSGY
jgi:hypothetical protein